MVLKLHPLVTVAGVSQILRGRDGRVVKAGALGVAYVKSWDRTWSSPDSKEVHILRWFQSRPQFYMAGVCQILRGQDGRVVKAGAVRGAHVKSWDGTKRPTGEGWY